MKKNIIIWSVAIILVVIAIFVVRMNEPSLSNIMPSPQVQSNVQDTSTPSGNTNSSARNSNSPSQNEKKDTNSDTLTEKSSGSNKLIDFTLPDLNGKNVSLKDFKGKAIYLNFFATWCPPCRAEMPGIEKLYQKYKSKDVVFLAIDIGEDKEKVKNFMDKNGLHFDVLLDTEEEVAQRYAISGIPVSIFIDKKGNIIGKKVGSMSEEAIESYLKKMVE